MYKTNASIALIAVALAYAGSQGQDPPPTAEPCGVVLIDFGPRNGDLLAVIGVAHDDTLNLRAGPGTTQAVVDVISPTFEDLIALGETRELDRSTTVGLNTPP